MTNRGNEPNTETENSDRMDEAVSAGVIRPVDTEGMYRYVNEVEEYLTSERKLAIREGMEEEYLQIIESKRALVKIPDLTDPVETLTRTKEEIAYVKTPTDTNLASAVLGNMDSRLPGGFIRVAVDEYFKENTEGNDQNFTKEVPIRNSVNELLEKEAIYKNLGRYLNMARFDLGTIEPTLQLLLCELYLKMRALGYTRQQLTA